MPAAESQPARPGHSHQAPELARNGRWVALGVEEYVAARGRNSTFPRQPERNTPMCRVAVDEKQIATRADLLHEPCHVAGMASQKTAPVTVHSDDKGYRAEASIKTCRELRASRIENDCAGFCLSRVGLGLQRQMQEYFFARSVRCVGQRSALWRRRQHGASDRTGKFNHAPSSRKLVTEIVDDDRKAWGRCRVRAAENAGNCDQKPLPVPKLRLSVLRDGHSALD
jgi:hypothetical protein